MGQPCDSLPSSLLPAAFVKSYLFTFLMVCLPMARGLQRAVAMAGKVGKEKDSGSVLRRGRRRIGSGLWSFIGGRFRRGTAVLRVGGGCVTTIAVRAIRAATGS
jgi:hypothetical protein